MMFYLKNTYLFSSIGRIIKFSEDEKGRYLVLGQTIFYPQGGGQPCDQGVICTQNKEILIDFVRQVNDEIRHYSEYIPEITINESCVLSIDSERRMLNARYHTAGQLIGNFIQKKFQDSEVLKSHHWPGEACMEFSYLTLSSNDISELTIEINQIIQQDRHLSVFSVLHEDFKKIFEHSYSDYMNKKELRAVQIEGFDPVPCGGTHLKSLKEIGFLTITKINCKKNVVRIYYCLKAT